MRICVDGHTVYEYSSGVSFLEDVSTKLEQSTTPAFDAITLDLNLPDISGFDVIATLITKAPYDAIPMIIITGAGTIEIQKVHSAYPKVPILQKPVTLDQIREALRHITSPSVPMLKDS